MKKRLLYVIIAGLLASTQMVSAKFAESGSVTKVENGTYYVVYETAEKTVKLNETVEYTLKGPGADVTFQAKRRTTGWGELILTEDTGSEIFKEGLSTSYVDKTAKISSTEVTKLIFTNPSPNNLAKDVQLFKVTMAQYLKGAPATVTLPASKVGTATSADFTFKWCNLGKNIIITSSNPELFEVTSDKTISAQAGHWNNAEKVTVKCLNTSAGTLTGDIYISDGTTTLTVKVTSEVAKDDATIKWYIPENVAVGELYDPAYEAPVTLNFTSDNENVIQVEDAKFMAVGEGSAIVSASITGDTYFNDVTFTRTITVANKERPVITWEQDLSVFPISTEPFALTASTNSGLSLTYDSSNPEVATVNNETKTLTIVGEGRTDITVSAEGNADYFSASMTKGMVVYDPVNPCPDFLLYDGGFSVSVGAELISNQDGKQYEIPWETGKAPATLSFSAQSNEELWVDNETDIEVAQKINGAWSTIGTYTVKKQSASTFSDIALNRQATAIRFWVKWNASGTTVTFTNVEVKQLRYLESDTESITFQPLNLNAQDSKKITINYSALQGTCFVSLEEKDKVFSLGTEGTAFGGGCGTIGTNTFTIKFSSQGLTPADCATYENAILIKNSQGGLEKRIPISGIVQQLQQTIVWAPTTTIQTIDKVTVPNTTIAPANMPITYATSDEAIAYVNDKFELVIIKHGTVTITANAAGDDTYQAASPVARTFTINTTPYTTTFSEETLETLSKVTYGTKLGDIVLTGAAADEAGTTVAGTFAFVDTELLPPPGETNEYAVVFTPTDANYYAPITIQATVTVNPRKTQNITWTQNIAAIPFGTESITLNAVTDAVPAADYPLVYTSSNPEVASVEGNVLTFHQVGETNITVSQAGDLNYDPTYLTKSLEVYDPTMGCTEYLLYAGSFTFASNWSSFSEGTRDITWDNSVTATTLRFTAKSEKGRKLYIDAYKGNTKQENWQEINIPKTETPYEYSFDPSITKFVFRMPGKEGGSGTAVYTNVEVVQQNYMNLSLTSHDFGTIEQNTVATQEISIDFSALPTVRNVHLESTDGVFTLIGNDAFGSGCGSTGTETFTVQFSAEGLMPEDMNTTFTNTLWIVANGEPIQSIPIQGTVKPRALVTTPEVAVPENSVFNELLYAAGVNMNPTYTGDVHVVDKAYYLMEVRAADDWHTFVAPFDITNAYVLELVPEPENPRAEGARDQMIAAQNTANTAFYQYLAANLPTANASTTVMDLIKNYIANTENAAVGISSIEGEYELHKSASEWELKEDENGELGFETSWTDITSTTSSEMKKGFTYAMRFPWCEYCSIREPWDYWTGKLILFEGEAGQTIHGKSEQENIPHYGDTENEAILTGNYTLAKMEINNAYVHNIETDMYDRVSVDTIVAPTTSIIYAQIPSKQGKRAKAIARTGQIIYEGDNSNVATALPTTSAASFTVVAQQDGMTIVGTATEPVAIYNISGVLLYAGTIHADEQRFIPAEAGMYIVRSAQAVQKVFVR